MDDRWQARVTVSVALLLYCASIILLVLSDKGPFTWGDFIAVTLSVISVIGLVAHAIPAVHIPGEQYAYLVTGWAGFTTMLLYLINTEDNHLRRAAVVLVLLTGTVGAYGAYLNSYPELDESR